MEVDESPPVPTGSAHSIDESSRHESATLQAVAERRFRVPSSATVKHYVSRSANGLATVATVLVLGATVWISFALEGARRASASHIAIATVLALAAALIGIVMYLRNWLHNLGTPFVLFYDKDHATSHLMEINDRVEGRIYNIWSLMHLQSPIFQRLIREQMAKLSDPRSNHTFIRIINCRRVDCEDVKRHLDNESISLMCRRKYHVWLTSGPGFGATVVDGKYAAINFPFASSDDRVLYVANDRDAPQFVEAVQTLIDSSHLSGSAYLSDPLDCEARELVTSESSDGIFDIDVEIQRVHTQVDQFFAVLRSAGAN